MTLTAATSGTPLSDEALSQAGAMLVNRFKTVTGNTVTATVNSNTQQIVLSLASAPSTATLRALIAPGRVSFREVLGSMMAILASPSASPAASPGPISPSGTVTLSQVMEKLGSLYGDAEKLSPDIDSQTVQQMAPFGALSPAEVAVLPAALQMAVPTITCGQLDSRWYGAVSDDAKATACDASDLSTKYYLDTSKVGNTDIKVATTKYDATAGWTVTVSFTTSGQSRWTAMTQDVMERASQNQNANPQVAILVDNVIVSAPVLQSVITGDALISGGSVTQTSASLLAALLSSGPLPVPFTVAKVS